MQLHIHIVLLNLTVNSALMKPAYLSTLTCGSVHYL